MAETVFKYQIYCETEEAWKFVWAAEGEPEPDKCPTNTAHTVNLDSRAIAETVKSQDVEIIEEKGKKTQGHFQKIGLIVPASVIDASTGWKVKDFAFPIPISIFAAHYKPKNMHDGDEIEFQINPDAVIGAISSDINSGVTVIPVTQTVMDNIQLGFFVKLDDGTNADELGMCTNIDTENNQITVETATTNSFAAATPTYVKITYKMVRGANGAGERLVEDDIIDVGLSKIGGSHISAGVVLRARYNNISGTSKDFSFGLEILF